MSKALLPLHAQRHMTADAQEEVTQLCQSVLACSCHNTCSAASAVCPLCLQLGFFGIVGVPVFKAITELFKDAQPMMDGEPCLVTYKESHMPCTLFVVGYMLHLLAVTSLSITKGCRSVLVQLCFCLTPANRLCWGLSQHELLTTGVMANYRMWEAAAAASAQRPPSAHC